MSRILLIFVSVFIIFSNAKEKAGEKCKICGYKKVSNKDLFRVVNGDSIDPTDYPWLVSIGDEKHNIFCSGALISSEYILTAAHCLGDPDKKGDDCKDEVCLRKAEDVEVGIWDSKDDKKPSKTLKVDKIIPHPDFDGESEDDILVHDIALLKLDKELDDCSEDFGPICLMKKNDTKKDDDPLFMAGWGFSSKKGPDKDDEKRVLRKGSIKQVPSEKCTHSKSKSKYTDMIICAVSSDKDQIPCEGDSGSSVFRKIDDVFYSIGVGSTIMRHKDKKACTLDGKVKYSKVAYHLKWIKEHVKDLPESEDDASSEEE